MTQEPQWTESDIAMQRANARSAEEGRQIAAQYREMLKRWAPAGGAPSTRTWH